MNEKTRVALGITIWGIVAICFLGAGIHFFATNGFPTFEDEAATTTTIVRDTPESVGIDSRHLANIETTVERHIAMGTTEGAVVAIVRSDKLVYLEAFGNIEHEGGAMRVDTRFDLASLTKPVATATSAMQLVERGMLRMDERVSDIIPEFVDYVDPETNETRYTTVGHLMSHTSGIRPYVALERLKEEYPSAERLDRSVMLDYIAHSERLDAPDSVCKYSCLNYILLGEIVERRTGFPLDTYAETNIFQPLGMTNTCFTPDQEYRALCAPTSPWDSELELRGVVHDPLAREVMAGVSGNAGLFSTAEDLAVYAAMLLNGGEWNGVKILTPTSVEVLFSRPNDEFMRTMAWEQLEAEYPTSVATYSHNGATGTNIVIDRERDMAIIILTNRTHANNKAGDITDLRSSIRAIVTYALTE